MSLSVTAATSADAPELAALAALTFPLACPPEVTAADSAEFIAAHLSEDAFAQYLADDSKRVLVARRGGNLIGYALLVFSPPSDPEVAEALRHLPGPAAELSKCYVHPAAHGTGAAAALMQAAVDAVVLSGCRTLWLGVNDLNLRAQSFYRKSGFVEAGRRSFTVGGQVFRDFILSLPLSPHGK
ncbi:GNAT family N-acetyltransferase [Arthrobacter sp. ATA002]|uniref:GNAT family N-acetyltransferase n=1 Tax=Arthrobacter sp. ATA002 TaxID=2991715 RepID=UPI0022A70686|nr:GNAT family N-acetyltransferase [Arthrobacter sp. ATA002]WAP51275.1 GNAT family N-acetyltransferase [Arthrobacter sp. ATA002]